MKERYLILPLIGFFLWRKKRLVAVKEKSTPLLNTEVTLKIFSAKRCRS